MNMQRQGVSQATARPPGGGSAPAVGPARSDRLTDFKYRWPARYRASWAALVFLTVTVVFIAPRTLSSASLGLVTALAGVLAIAALGQTLIIMLGAIDLSVSAIMSLSAGMVVHYGGPGANAPVVIMAALAVSVVLSLLNGVLITVFGLNALIVTLATFGIISGGIKLWTGVSLSLTGQAPESLTNVAQKTLFGVNACFLFALVAAVLLAAALGKTRFGRRVAAVGVNRRAARALGIRVTFVELSTFALAGLLYGIAAVLLAGYIGTPDVAAGAPYQMATITVAGIAGVLFTGGPASVAGVVSAALFLQLLDQALAIIGLSAGERAVIQGLALVIAVAAITLGQYGVSGISRSLKLVVRRAG
ncbi:ABC transporter permease [Streptomyces griseorubiginosus]|uniref:ABC transporter permease n=1 Tax=Streptomyces griseorubiginosus TaxID=67304 RepID=UPI0033D3D767